MGKFQFGRKSEWAASAKCNTLCSNVLKSCSIHQVPLLKKANVQPELKVQQNFTTSRGQWMGPCTAKSWMSFSFQKPEWWRCVSQHDTEPNNTTKPTKEWPKSLDLNHKSVKRDEASNCQAAAKKPQRLREFL